jgi:hypothetical protein
LAGWHCSHVPLHLHVDQELEEMTIEPDFHFRGVPIYGEYDHCPIEVTSFWLEIQILRWELKNGVS